MSTQTLFNKTGAVFAALASVAALALSAPSVRASSLTPAQGEITNDIHSIAGNSTKTILTASAKVLAQAVAAAITSDTTSSTPAELAEAALEYVPTTTGSATRTDLNAAAGSAALVTGTAIEQQISTTGTNFPNLELSVDHIITDIATVNAVVVSGTNKNPAHDLSVAGQENVIKTALQTIANAAVATPNPNPHLTTANYLALDQSIGTAIADTTDINTLAKNALVTILQAAIVGIDGVNVGTIKYTTLTAVDVPYSAAAFVKGIIASGTVAQVSGTSFDVAILKNVVKNTTAAELVAYQIGTKDGSGAVTSIADALFKAYPAAVAKVTQGLADSLTASVGEAARTNFIKSLITTAQVSKATAVLEGAVFTDPYYAASFTKTVFNSVAATARGIAAVQADAPTMATDIGEILGQDGNVLTQVSGTFADFITSGTLPVAKAATYASDLVAGAVKGLPAANFLTNPLAPYTYTAGSDGGILQTGSGAKNTAIAGYSITTPVANDLVNIEDLFANAIVSATPTIDTKAGATTAGAELGTLAEDIARITKNEFFTSHIGSVPVAQYLAGTLADYIVSLDLNAAIGTGASATTPQKIIIADLEKDLKAVSDTAVDTDLLAAVNGVVNNTPGDRTTYQYATGPIGSPETAITNF